MTSYPFKSAGNSARGPWPHPVSVEYACYVRNAAALVGQCWMQDYTASDGETSTAGSGNIQAVTHIMANVIKPSSGGILNYSGGPFFGVALRAGAENALVRLCMFGYCDALTQKGSGNTAIGDPLTPNTSAELDADAGTKTRIVAQAQEVLTSPSTAALGEVLFNGVGGVAMGFHDSV